MSTRVEYVLEVVVTRKKLTEKLRILDQLFQIKYQITHCTWISIIHYELYSRLGDEKLEKLKELQEGQYPIVEFYYIGKSSTVRERH